MAWSGLKKPVKPWVIDLQRDPCDCSQKLPLSISGYSEKQGPTHYCPVCRWCFWTVEMKPSADQISLAKKDHPEACEANMKYMKLRNKPNAKWGSTSETLMLDQIGKLNPSFLTVKLREYWAKKYCEKYPNSDRAKARARMKEAEARRLGIS